MAFTSESILTFGTSPVSFAVVTLLNYSMQNEKAGVFNTRRKETVSLEGLFSNVGVNLPITEHFSQIRSLIQASDDFLDLKLNGVSYGKAKFTSFSFPTSVGFDQNAARFSKFTIQLEIVKEDASNAFANGNLPTDVVALSGSWSWSRLTDFSENFSFKLNDDGNFDASHSISFGYNNIDKLSDLNVVDAAKTVASSFFRQALKDLSSIDSLYSSTDFQNSVNDYGSSLTEQSVDLINYKFAYSKNYTVFSQNGTNTSETIMIEVSYKEDGVIEVSEKGRIKGKGESYAIARTNAITKLNENLSNAYARCNSSFNTYFTTTYGTFVGVIPKYNSSDTLRTVPVSIAKDLTDITSEVGYDIKFTTNAAYDNSTRIHSYSISVKKDSVGVYQATKNGSIKFYTNKRKNFSTNMGEVRTIVSSDSFSDINAYYQKVSGLATYAGIRTDTTISSAKFGAEVSYSITYSNSPTLKAPGLVRKVTVTEGHQNPVNKFSTIRLIGSSVNVPTELLGKISNKKLGKEIIYQTRQLSEGSRNITLEMKIDREQLYSGSVNGVNTSTASIFAKIKDLFTFEMLDRQSGYLFSGSSPWVLSIFSKIYADSSLKPGELTYFLDDLKLSIDNNYTLKVDLVYKFLISKEKI